jgi:hypothetical protein
MAYSKPELRKRIVAQVKASSKGGKPGQWSARKAQEATKRYEAAGGGYSGPRTAAQRSLSKWTKEEWGTKSGRPSVQGPKASGERYLPKKAIAALSAAEYRATSERKRQATRRGQQFVSNTPAAKAAGRRARNK